MNTGSCKILFADDDAEDRGIIADACDELGFADQIALVEDGEDVLSLLESLGNDLPKLIVLDLNMPRIDGKQTLRQLKASPRFRHIRVVMFSTSANPHDIRQCLLMGATHYYTKPRSYDKYLELMRWYNDFCSNASIEALSDEVLR